MQAQTHLVQTFSPEDKHEHGVGFLVHKDIVNTDMECRPVSSRLIIIRPRAVHFNITTVQAFAPPTDYDGNEVEELCNQLQNVIDQHRRRTFLLCKEGGMHKWVRMLVNTGKAFADPSAMTQMRERTLTFGEKNLKQG